MASIVISEYLNLLNELKEKIRLAQMRTVLAVNVQMLAVYWEIGQVIASHEKEKGWGAKIVDHLAADLRIEFPKLKGLSPRNLRYMRNFSKAWPELTILQQAAAKLDTESILQQAAAKLPHRPMPQQMPSYNAGYAVKILLNLETPCVGQQLAG